MTDNEISNRYKNRCLLTAIIFGFAAIMTGSIYPMSMSIVMFICALYFEVAKSP
jgi:hypothetical protein